MVDILDWNEPLTNYQGPPFTFFTDALATLPLWNSSDSMPQYTYKFMSDGARYLCI